MFADFNIRSQTKNSASLHLQFRASWMSLIDRIIYFESLGIILEVRLNKMAYSSSAFLIFKYLDILFLILLVGRCTSSTRSWRIKSLYWLSKIFFLTEEGRGQVLNVLRKYYFVEFLIFSRREIFLNIINSLNRLIKKPFAFKILMSLIWQKLYWPFGSVINL